MDNKQLERYSSAFTLSDMEIFIFPELYYSLVLANIMSPTIWKWREDPWFDKIEKKSFNYKINRVKQYIMDHYVFNLDLDTWGLTTKESEINRFKEFVDIDVLRQSNALFGYEGDKYYFSIDIRKHFGLDKYTSEAIPYWKTETVEAMDAFKFKENYTTGAGECVSLATLYAAALFIVGRIPLDKIYLLGTPLHSQNFIDEKDGIVTNNRRIVTKSMWYNGTLLSAKARRAVENEKITIVAHNSGHIHTIFPEATIDPEAYQNFSKKFKAYLDEKLTFETFVCFLRSQSKFWHCFQLRYERNGKSYYIELSKVFETERGSKNSLSSATSRDALMGEIDAAEFHLSPRTDKLMLNDFEEYLNQNPDVDFVEKKNFFEKNIMQKESCPQMATMFDMLKEFLHIDPKLPDGNKNYVKQVPVDINSDMSREAIIAEVLSKVSQNVNADLSLYAYRMMDKVDWAPFLKAVFERNPVCNDVLQGLSVDEAYQKLNALENISIYEGDNRLAMPDEVWNFQRGDGIEKAIALANYIRSLDNKARIILTVENNNVKLNDYSFETLKRLNINKVLN